MISQILEKPVAKVIIYLFSIILIIIETPISNLNFILHAIGMIPLAFMLGELTSIISEYIGEKKGGLLTATLGNIPEIMMSIWSMKLGMISMVKGAVIGNIVNNMLLILGVSVLLGGIKYKEQTFNKSSAKMNYNMLLLAMSAMALLSCINSYAQIDEIAMNNISKIVSFILIGIYILNLIFSIYTHGNLFSDKNTDHEGIKKNKKRFIISILQLVFIVVLIYFASEKLINDASIFIRRYNVSETFMGIILVPLIGNIGENISAIVCAIKNKINLSLEIAVGSSIQIALFSTPLLILIAGVMGIGMTLAFSIIHIIIIAIAILMSFIVFGDGKTYWFEGCILISIYIITTLCYFYVV